MPVLLAGPSGITGGDLSSALASYTNTTDLQTNYLQKNNQYIQSVQSGSVLSVSGHELDINLSAYKTDTQNASVYLKQVDASGTYLSKSSATSTYVPFSGATKAVDLNNHSLLSVSSVSFNNTGNPLQMVGAELQFNSKIMASENSPNCHALIRSAYFYPEKPDGSIINGDRTNLYRMRHLLLRFATDTPNYNDGTNKYRFTIPSDYVLAFECDISFYNDDSLGGFYKYRGIYSGVYFKNVLTGTDSTEVIGSISAQLADGWITYSSDDPSVFYITIDPSKVYSGNYGGWMSIKVNTSSFTYS